MGIKVFRQHVSDDTARFYMALMLWTLVLEIVTALLLIDLPQANREIVLTMAGTIVGGLISSANYYNKTGVQQDRQKDDTIHTLSTTAASIQSTAHPDAAPTVTLQPGDTATVAAEPSRDARD